MKIDKCWFANILPWFICWLLQWLQFYLPLSLWKTNFCESFWKIMETKARYNCFIIFFDREKFLVILRIRKMELICWLEIFAWLCLISLFSVFLAMNQWNWCENWGSISWKFCYNCLFYESIILMNSNMKLIWKLMK